MLELLADHEASDIAVFGGGIIPDEDIDALKSAGVREIFTPGTPMDEIIGWVRSNISPRALD